MKLWSHLWFLWVGDVLRRGVAAPHTFDSLLDLFKEDLPDRSFSRMQSLLDQERGSRWAVHRAVCRFMGRPWIIGVGLMLIHVCAQVLSALLLGSFTRVLSGGEPTHDPLLRMLPAGSKYAGPVTACLLFLLAVVTLLTVHHAVFVLLRAATSMKGALTAVLYRKALRLTLAARLRVPSGYVVNLISNDLGRLWNYTFLSFSPVGHTLQIVLVVTLLVWLLGPSAFVGIGVMAALILVSALIAKLNLRTRKDLLTVSDSRLTVVREALTGIRAIKLYGWDRAVTREISGLREHELVFLRRLSFVLTASNMLFLSTPVLVAVATFSALSLQGSLPLLPDVIAALSLFAVLRWGMTMLPDSIILGIEAFYSLNRISDYLTLPEAPAAVTDPDLPRGTVAFRSVTSLWDENKPAVRNVSLSIRPGEIIGVVGTVGSGKSALLLTVLRETFLKTGVLDLSGTLAYVPQQPWIVSGTVKENITLGQSFDAERYRASIHTAGLVRDIALLPEKDDTLLGEQGVNLSGGQKQRISLARAVYADADVYLLDDPFSSLDNTVGSFVYRSLLCRHLSGRTRILVTHRPEYLTEANRVLVMHDGEIVDSGEFSEIARRHPNLFGPHHEGGPSTSDSAGSERAGATDQEQDVGATRAAAHHVIDAEERRTGSVTKGVYWYYFSKFSPPLIAAALAVLFLGKDALQVATDWWLSLWSSREELHSSLFLSGFLALGGAVLVVGFVRTVVLRLRGIAVSKTLHEDLVQGVFRAPLRFFEANPTGRILNRFSGDIEAADVTVPGTVLEVCASSSAVLLALLFAVAVQPIVLVVVVPLALLYVRLQRVFRITARESQRLYSISKSPIFSLLSEGIAGLVVIRASHWERPFLKRMLDAVYMHSRTDFTIMSVNRWIGIRLELIGACIAFAAALAPLAAGSGHGADPGGQPFLFGLSVMYVLSIAGSLNWFIRMLTQLETSMNSIERLQFYSSVPSERWEGTVPAEPWPARGKIEIRDLDLRYRPELPPALQGLSLTVEPGEHIGIAGRTGAGKSSLLLALCRLVEPSAGSIAIDGLPIDTVALETLRGAVAVIPQDPVLFRGSLRRNLDPASRFSDKDLTEALHKTHLSDLLRALPGGLSAEIAEGGLDLSVGQRQLLCLTRALLRGNKILLLDEATAHVDSFTDRLIQSTIRREFRHATVLTIAHRLHTILDYDRVVILDHGRVAEFGAPAELLRNRSSLLRKLLDDEGQLALHARGKGA